MLKRIPKSDISIRPFKAYKEWSFVSGSADIAVLEAQSGNYASLSSNVITTGSLSGSSFNKHSVYGQLRAQFYNGNEDNVFTRTGNKTKVYNKNLVGKERFLNGNAKVISIPNVYVGEGIKKGSLTIIDNKNTVNEITYTDDGYSNLKNALDNIIINLFDIELNLVTMTDTSDNNYGATLPNGFDIMTGTIDILYNGTTYTITIEYIDIEAGVLVSSNIPFLPQDARGIKIGNVFYNQGLIVLTRDSATKLINDWEVSYKSTQTIYEHEYLLIANEDEFNVSTNPSAIVNIGRQTETHIDTYGQIQKITTNPGVNYIRKKSILENGNEIDYRFGSSVNSSVSGGFEHYDVSGATDSTGSFLSPFITTIGLYDDDCQLVAVAKLPQPIKSEPDIPVNFIIRFDT